jgi:hypothetical protein
LIELKFKEEYEKVSNFIFSSMANAQTEELAKCKSLFKLNFIRYIGWPEDAKGSDFVIGVLKNSQMADQLKAKTNGKKIDYQNIIIKKFKNVDDISNCQILYIDGIVNYSKHALAISQKLNNNNSLIITEGKNAILNGSMINFVIVDEKLKFEVSSENAEKYGLKLSNTLLLMNKAIKL